MKFLIISYKSRTAIFSFAQILKRNNINYSIINTPRNIALSCGLSLRVDIAFLKQVKHLISTSNIYGFWGLFLLTKTATHDQIERLI